MGISRALDMTRTAAAARNLCSPIGIPGFGAHCSFLLAWYRCQRIRAELQSIVASDIDFLLMPTSLQMSTIKW